MPPKIVSKDAKYVSPLQQLQTKNAPNKRIRVSRACDTCRKRKVKCDGKQPCIHCTVYSYECTYNQYIPPQPKKQKKEEGNSLSAAALSTSTSTTARSTTTTTATAGSSKSAQVELLRQLFPEVDMLSDTFNADLFVQLFERHKKDGVVDMRAILDDYKHSGGALSSPSTANTTKSSSSTQRSAPNSSFNPHSHTQTSLDPVEIRIILPPREIALKLIYKTWNESCVLFRFYHRPSFIRDFNSLYETTPSDYSNHQNKMLPLIYSVIAVGALFSKGDNAIDNQYLQDEGYKYFIAARKLIDITNSTDLESIQTIFMLTLFLQCSARLSTCYSYIGIALRSALRQGIHRKLEVKCNHIKAECKKRLFWTIYKLEIYVNSMLGLPNSIDEDDIDAELPQDLDDVNIELDKLTPQQQGKLSSCGINNSHTKLILILNHIMKKLYKPTNPIYTIPQEVIRGLENELELWVYRLPYQLQMGNANIPVEYVKANRLLHLDYLHVQIMLYRPYIHYVKLALTAPLNTRVQSYQYENGMKCFEVSKQIVTLAKDMIQSKLLNGSYWFSVYTIFFSVACLVYYFLEIDNTDEEVKHSIEIGKLILSGLKQRSVSAERIYDLLNHMFENYDRHNIHLQEIQSQRETPQPTTIKRVPQSGPFTSHEDISSVPLNTYTSPNNTPAVNTMATHTFDNPHAPSQSSRVPTNISRSVDPVSSSISSFTGGTTSNNGNMTPVISSIPMTKPVMDQSSTIEDIDLQLFGRFLPSYMLQKPIETSGGAGGDVGVSSASRFDLVHSSESPDDLMGNSNGGSIRTDEQDFDWDRFIDKGDVLNFDFDL